MSLINKIDQPIKSNLNTCLLAIENKTFQEKIYNTDQ